MKTRTFSLAGRCLLAALATSASAAADWTGFRGPDGSGMAAADARPPTTWSEAQNVRWKADLPGPGSSSPVVLGARIFVTCYSGYGEGGGSPAELKRHLLCFDRATGRKLWEVIVPAVLPEDPFQGYLTEHGYASSTPATDGERVYVFFGKSGAFAFDLAGKQLWQADLGRQSSNRRWGSASSPVLYRDVVILNASEESRSVRALDRRTGREVWRAEDRALELSYGTPTLVPVGNDRVEVALAIPGLLWGLDPATGQRLWTAETGIGGNVAPTAIAAAGVVYATGGYPRLGTAAVRAGGSGDVTSTHRAWTSAQASYVPSPVAYQGRLYFVSDQGLAFCLATASGEVVYKERLPDVTNPPRGGKPFYASPVLADGRLYAVSRRNGTYVLAAGPEYKLLAQNRLAGDDSDFSATPAIVGREIYLRSNRALYRIE